MKRLFAAALNIQRFFEQRQWQFCIIGGIAVLRWGEPRFTRDVDITLLTGFGREEGFIQLLLAAGYRERTPGAGIFALRSRVLLLDAPDGVPVDVALAGLPFEELTVERSSLFEFEPGCRLRTCSAEDLIVHKLFASRTLDLHDAEKVAVRQRGNLDWDYIETQLGPLAELKEDPEIMDELAKLRRVS